MDETRQEEYKTVKPIDPGSHMLYDALGITKERVDLLTTKMKKYIEESNNIAEIISKVSRDCVHSNELSYISFALGNFLGKKQQRSVNICIVKPGDNNDDD